MLHAARGCGTQVIWDLCHYGWPDDIDIWSADFIERFACFAAATAALIRDEGEGTPYYCPINEMAFWAWAGGHVGRFNPCALDRGPELNRQLVRAAIAASREIRIVDPRAKFVCAEPLINVLAGPDSPQDIEAAESKRLSQFESLDLLTGRLEPELGGSPDLLDLVGLNFYPDNQWVSWRKHDPAWPPCLSVSARNAGGSSGPVRPSGLPCGNGGGRIRARRMASLRLQRGQNGPGHRRSGCGRLSVSGHRLPWLGERAHVPGRALVNARRSRQPDRL